MTREEIKQMPAGREMDIAIGHLLDVKPPIRWLVVDKIEGGAFIGFDCKTGANNYLAEARRERPNGMIAQKGEVQPWEVWPRYSADIAAAWRVVEHLRASGWASAHTDLTVDSGQDWWSWHFTSTVPPGNASVSAQASTPVHAICRAALLTTLIPA